MRNLLLFFALYLVSCQPQQPPAPAPVKDDGQANKALIEQYYQHFNQHDWEKMTALYTETAEMKDPSFEISPIQMTRAEIVKKYQELQQAIPDVQDKIVKMYPSNDHIIVEFISSGTGPDGKKFELPICTIFEIKDGKITKDYTYFDNF